MDATFVLRCTRGYGRARIASSALVAQWTERRPPKPKVVGSTPAERTIRIGKEGASGGSESREGVKLWRFRLHMTDERSSRMITVHEAFTLATYPWRARFCKVTFFL